MVGKSSSSARSAATENFRNNGAYVYLIFFFIVFI